MYPHERSLVKRLEGKPFAILGVNSDPKDRLKQVLKKEQMSWRSWWDRDTSGPIATKWNVAGWPTLYVLDHKGVIRNKWVGSPGDDVLDRTVESLVKEAENASAKN